MRCTKSNKKLLCISICIMRYSNDLRKKAMDMHFIQKKEIREISELLNISYRTLQLWKRKYQENPNSLYKIIPSPGRRHRYDYEKLKEFVEENPDKYIREIQQEFFKANGLKASFGGIHKALKKIGFTLKKKPSYTERGMRKREESINRKD